MATEMGGASGRRWPVAMAWAGLALVLAAGLALGAGLGRSRAGGVGAGSARAGSSGARNAAGAGSASPTGNASASARIDRLDHLIGCPSCTDLSVAESNAASALAIRQLVSRQVRAGASDRAIEARVVASYGGSILLRPPTSGIAGAVWALPILGGALAVAATTVMFCRRRGALPAVAGDEDRALVDRALVELAAGGPGTAEQ